MLNNDSRNKKTFELEYFTTIVIDITLTKNDGFQVVSHINVCSASYFTCNKHNGTGNNSKLSIRKQNII